MEKYKKSFSDTQVSVIVKHALRGLAYLHSINILHRDIKAGNIFLNGEGIAKLGDFGISKQITATQTRRYTVIGTPFWMAPEV